MNVKLVLFLLIAFCAIELESKSVKAENNGVNSQENMTCKSVVGYFNGKFQNKDAPKITADVEFQIRPIANDTTGEFFLAIDRWNEKKSSTDDFALWIENERYNTNCLINITECIIWFEPSTGGYFMVALDHYNKEKTMSDNQFRFLYFPLSNNTFTLTNTIGKCTKNQVQNPLHDKYNPDASLFEYCLCCGDKYEPDPKLGCPKNPWA